MKARRDVFQAIADPTRRAIIGMIAGEAVNVNTIAEKFDISRQAISLHLKVLSECGLLNIKHSGRERLCEARLEMLSEVHEWTGQYRRLWTHRFKSLKSFLEQEEPGETTPAHTAKKSKRNVKSSKQRI